MKAVARRKCRFRPAFGSLRAGEALWDRIAEVLRQPSPDPAVLTCYHRVTALGFQGVYCLKAVSQSQRDEVMKALSERVSPPDAGLSPGCSPDGETSLASDALSLVLDSARRHSYRRYLVGRAPLAPVSFVITNTGVAWLMRGSVIIPVALHVWWLLPHCCGCCGISFRQAMFLTV